MKVLDLAQKLGFQIANKGDGNDRDIDGVYCCDLLSIVMGRAKTNDAWITVMGNVNSIAVAVLSDVSCIILSEGMQLDQPALNKAIGQQICVLSSELPTFEIALKIAKELEL